MNCDIMGKFKLKKKKNNKKLSLLFFILFLSCCISYYLALNISKKITPVLIDVAYVKLTKYSTLIVNSAVDELLEEDYELDDLFTVVKNKNDEIQMIDFDSVKVNSLINKASNSAYKTIKLLEEGNIDKIIDKDLEEEEINNLNKGIIMKLPIGSFLSSSLFSNIGPMIPVRFHYIGDVNSNIETKVTEYGVNNALIEIDMVLELTTQIYLPFQTEVKSIECRVPIIIKMINGTVPNYYSGSVNNDLED